MKIAAAADHGGFALKDRLVARLRSLGHDVDDFGSHDATSVDYPDFAALVAAALRDGKAERGLLVCGSGIGMSIGANREPAVRAVLAMEILQARLGRAHNDANVLCLGGRLTGDALAEAILDEFLATPFEGGRHAGRVAKLTPAC